MYVDGQFSASRQASDNIYCLDGFCGLITGLFVGLLNSLIFDFVISVHFLFDALWQTNVSMVLISF